MCDADVYVLIHHRARYYTYKSTEHPGWPSSEEEVVSQKAPSQRKILTYHDNEKERFYLIPERKTEADFEQNSREDRCEEQGQPLGESPARMVLPQSLSLSLNEFNAPNVHAATVTSSAQHPAQPEVVEPDGEWEVSQILDCRRFHGKLRYFVAWRGYPPSWQPSKNLRNCADLVRTFHNQKRTLRSNSG